MWLAIPKPRHCLIAIVVLALGARLAVAVLTRSWVFPSDRNFWGFAYEMGQIAASLALGNGFSWPDWSELPAGPTAWMAPIFPLIMAGMFKIFGIFICKLQWRLNSSSLSCLY
jgi:hypothetical protein